VSTASSLSIAIGTAAVLGVLTVLFAVVALVQRRRQHEAQALADDSQEQLAVLSSTNHLGLWKWDGVTGFVASKKTRSMLGIGENAALDREVLLAAIHPEDQELVLEAISALMSADGSIEREVRVVAPGRDIRWIIVKACAFGDSHGAHRRVTGFLIDDSPRRQVTAELHTLQRNITHLTRVAMLGELSGALAHELQQPLTTILCNAQAAQMLIAKGCPDVKELRELLEEIVKDDRHAGEIIHSLRALLLRGERQVQRVAIGNLIRDVLSVARGALVERNIQVSTRIDESIPEIQGDRVELQQVLLNLILNASESMSANPPRDRRIEIVAALDDCSAATRISVFDCGTGIDPGQLDRVFDPFYTTKANGLGLGLAICHSIIDAHQGELWAANRADRGAVFHFQLPVTLRRDANEQQYANSVHSG
jgi:C4-dicarboxylate-specific signal transduction histidine kinase